MLVERQTAPLTLGLQSALPAPSTAALWGPLRQSAHIDAQPPRCTLPAMSLTTAFISELVWAANQVEHVTNFEKRRSSGRHTTR